MNFLILSYVSHKVTKNETKEGNEQYRRMNEQSTIIFLKPTMSSNDKLNKQAK